MTLLGYERGEAAATFPLMFRTELDRLVALAKERGATDDPIIRQRLAWCHSKVEIMRYLGLRSLTQFLARPPARSGGGIFKLYWSEYHREVTELAVDILGADAHDPERPLADLVVPDRRRRARPTTAPAGSARSSTPGPARSTPGSSEIQRNIVGELVLGLPKEPRGADPGSWRDAAGGPVPDRSAGRWRPRCGAVLPHPSLWRTGLRQVAPAAPARDGGAGRRSSRCPAPDYLRFRMETAYGGRRRPARRSPTDLVTYLRWCRRLPAVAATNAPSPVEPPPVTFRRCRGPSCSTPPMSRCASCPAAEPSCSCSATRPTCSTTRATALHSEHLTLAGAVGDPAAALREGAVPSAGAAQPARACSPATATRCQYCGVAAESIDHVVPRSRGGEHTLGERGGGVPTVQRPQARPAPPRDDDGAAPSPHRAARADLGRRSRSAPCPSTGSPTSTPPRCPRELARRAATSSAAGTFHARAVPADPRERAAWVCDADRARPRARKRPARRGRRPRRLCGGGDRGGAPAQRGRSGAGRAGRGAVGRPDRARRRRRSGRTTSAGRSTGWGRRGRPRSRSSGVAAEVHRGAPACARRGPPRCASRASGPGEVTVAGRKVVGITQRRTRAAARFQCAALGRWDPDGDRAAARPAAGRRAADLRRRGRPRRRRTSNALLDRPAPPPPLSAGSARSIGGLACRGPRAGAWWCDLGHVVGVSG